MSVRVGARSVDGGGVPLRGLLLAARSYRKQQKQTRRKNSVASRPFYHKVPQVLRPCGQRVVP